MSAMASWIVIVSQAAAASLPSPVTPPAETVVPGVALLRGAILPGRGPDGNTIVFDAPEGLVVVDTGRHDWHSAAILALARERGRPIVAILNTHWHLDHSSGNGRIKAAFPDAPVYTGRRWVPRPEPPIRAADAG
jgi:glyoxylase-like metal-dependent hydrolase (beta-lactamase superfamily II)